MRQKKKSRVALIIRTKHVRDSICDLATRPNTMNLVTHQTDTKLSVENAFVHASISNGNIQQDAESLHCPYEEKNRVREKE